MAKDDERSKYFLTVTDVDYMTYEQCRKQVDDLKVEYLLVERLHNKMSEALPILHGVMIARFKELHNRICFIAANEKTLKDDYKRPSYQ